MRQTKAIRSVLLPLLCQTSLTLPIVLTTIRGARILANKINVEGVPRDLLAVRLQFNPLEGGGRKMVARVLYKTRDTSADLRALGFDDLHLVELEKLRRACLWFDRNLGADGFG